ncbi:MAG: thiamine pyrophosphate-dependent enzyme [Candidatus Melainabacteria bacterium]|jgi:pyruvate ferredoxin oxidoreductase beta subunit|nr:thiamine pyrophosphate-dependent enzyme [Candidatus Melainabacteria bacterium]
MMMNSMHTAVPEQKFPDWYDGKRAMEVLDAYNTGSGTSQPADKFVAQSVLPASTGASRDFSYIAPELPQFNESNCVGCMDCVTNCPDTAILGKIVMPETLETELAKVDNADYREHLRSQFSETLKYYTSFEKKKAKDDSLVGGGKFGIFIDPTKCKGCGECVAVCGDHDALKMVKKTPENLPEYLSDFGFYRTLPASPISHINPKDKRDIMLKPSAIKQYAGGAGSCMGCGEASVIRQVLAMTNEVVGDRYGIVASTGCNTVYASTYPYNPYSAPWTNSLFENGPADAMGIRSFWDQSGHEDWAIWNVGGDGAMMDIGFQSLSRLLASGMNVKVLVLDTQVYSNTGGQQSTSSYMGQESKMGAHGKSHAGKGERRKELAQLCIMHPHVFVAQTVGPMTNHFYKVVERALRFKGPAVINVYTTCQPEHGVADDMAATQAKNAVKSRAFPLLIYDPEAGATLKQRISLEGNPSPTRDWVIEKTADGTEVPYNFMSWAKTEGRFKKHFDDKGNPLSESLLLATKDRLDNWRLLQQLAGVENPDFASELALV